jgi:hypothetical protein
MRALFKSTADDAPEGLLTAEESRTHGKNVRNITLSREIMKKEAPPEE